MQAEAAKLAQLSSDNATHEEPSHQELPGVATASSQDTPQSCTGPNCLVAPMPGEAGKAGAAGSEKSTAQAPTARPIPYGPMTHATFEKLVARKRAIAAAQRLLKGAHSRLQSVPPSLLAPPAACSCPCASTLPRHHVVPTARLVLAGPGAPREYQEHAALDAHGIPVPAPQGKAAPGGSGGPGGRPRQL
jgi:hypothetical protein